MAGLTTRRQFIRASSAAAAGAFLAGSGTRLLAQSAQIYNFFALNTQDFAYPQQSADLVWRVIDLHESLDVPIDISLTTTMVDVYEAQYRDLLRRLFTSHVVCLGYHGRPPLPYHTDFDWLGMSRMSSDQQRSTIYSYETHGLDLVTGQPTLASGGYAKLVSLAGYAPPSVGILVDGATLQASADAVLAQLGAQLGVVHGRAANLGDRRNELYVRPEHYDLKLFQQVGRSATTVLDEAMAAAPSAEGGRAPYVVGIKMHDNDFFAEDSAWTTVYLAKGARQGPPWNTALKSPLLSAEAQQQMWDLYESTVRYAASIRGRVPIANSRDWQRALGIS
jgi:hypothetical protein